MATSPAKAEKWFTIPELVELLGVSRATVYRLIAAGRLDVSDAGLGSRRTKSRIPESAVAKYQASTAMPAPKRGRAA